MAMSWTAFAGNRRLASGTPDRIILTVKAALSETGGESVLVFDDSTGGVVDIDLRGTDAEITARVMPPQQEPPRGPGRPKLGVVSREVTLLPRHWDWLNAQAGGASVALRKLVETARALQAGPDRKRAAQAAADRFMSAMAGNETGYEDASRALYSGDRTKFTARIATWPVDIRDQTLRLAAPAFEIVAD